VVTYLKFILKTFKQASRTIPSWRWKLFKRGSKVSPLYIITPKMMIWSVENWGGAKKNCPFLSNFFLHSKCLLHLCCVNFHHDFHCVWKIENSKPIFSAWFSGGELIRRLCLLEFAKDRMVFTKEIRIFVNFSSRQSCYTLLTGSSHTASCAGMSQKAQECFERFAGVEWAWEWKRNSRRN